MRPRGDYVKVCHIITGLGTGGAEHMLLKLVRAMPDEFEHVVVSLMDEGSMGAAIREAGAVVHTLGLRRGSLNARALISLRQILQRHSPDLLQGWMYHGNFVAQLARRVSPGRPPVVWTVRQSLHDIANEKRTTWILIQLGAVLSRGVPAIIYNSRTSAKHHEELGYRSGATVVIPNGFEVELYRPDPAARVALRQALGVPAETPLVGIVARHHPVKDHDTFLRGAAHLLAANPDVHFVLVGRGIERTNAELARLISELDLQHRVHLLGERRDVHHVTAGFDVATLCSLSEAFPNAVGEAMSCGVPTVVTDVGDAPMLVGDTGIVVPVRTPAALADAWRALLAEPADVRKRRSTAARARILDHFSIDAVAEQYASVYRVVGGARSGELQQQAS